MFRIQVIAGHDFKSNGTPLQQWELEIARHQIATYASDKFGGITFQESEGSWKNDRGVIVTERGWVLTTIVENDATSGAAWREFADFVRDTLEQSAVVLTVDEVSGRIG